MEIKIPMDVARLFPVRKSANQKQQFRSAVTDYLEGLGYPVSTEKGSFGARNVVIGNPETAKYLVTAHYDTCARLLLPNFLTPCSLFLFSAYQILISTFMIAPAFAIGAAAEILLDSYWAGYWVRMLLLLIAIAMVMIGPANSSNQNDNTSGVVTVLEIARSLPEKLREKVCFVLFDLEEAGLIGSHSYRQTHKKASSQQMVLNLDCVGDGSEIVFFPTTQLKKDAQKLAVFDSICGKVGRKRISVHKKGFGIYPSDQKQFPYGVGICALNRNWAGLYLSRIHTPRDTILDETNVNILRAALISWIGSRAEE